MTENSATKTADDFALDNLLSRWDRLSQAATLSDLSDKLSRLNDDVEGLKSALKKIRERGYVFDKQWERQAAVIRSRWPRQRREAEKIYDEQKRDLQRAAGQAERLVNRAERSSSLIDNADRKLDTLEEQIDGATQKAERAISSTEDGAAAIYEGLEWAEFLLDTLDESTFKLHKEEDGVAACKAEWISHKEESKGFLYLTDQRLIFEQKEEIATKKILFVTTAKEMVHKKLWDAPIGGVDKVSAADEGGVLGFGVKELLVLQFNRDVDDVPDDEITLRFKDYADNERWATLIERVKSGRIERDRYKARSAPAKRAAPKAIPTECGSCGATLPTVFKGMQQVECEYCGKVMRLD